MNHKIREIVQCTHEKTRQNEGGKGNGKLKSEKKDRTT